MDYMGWVLSIYDECIKRYNEKYTKKMTWKEVFKKISSKENRYDAIALFILVLYIVGIIAITILYFLGVIKRVEEYLIIASLLLAISYIPQMYRYELKLDDYKKKLTVLLEILDEESLNTVESIERLSKDTEGILNKIKSSKFDSINKFILTVSGLSAAIGVKNINLETQTIKNSILIVLAILIFSAFIIWVVYSVLTTIPNSRITRRQKFHELLRILLIYKGVSERKEENTQISEAS